MIKSIIAVLLLSSGLVSALDFTKISDICEPTDTQSCPNKPDEIKALQEALNENPNLYLYIKADGKWSEGTKEAIIVFQEHYGIKPASGYVGRYTKKILQKVTHPDISKNIAVEPKQKQKKAETKKSKKALLPNAKPTREFVLYGDMCDNTIKGNNCPNNLIEVSNLQILLNADPNLNVNITADGKWGPGTQKAVIAFQKFYGIKPAKGYIGARTKKVLDRVAGAMLAKAAMPVSSVPRTSSSASTPISAWKNICEKTAVDSCPNRPEDVRALQKLLNKTMGLKLSVDGKWGKGTRQAVIKFQKQFGISPANGYVGPKTRRTMQKVSNKTAGKTHGRSRRNRIVVHPIKTYADFKKYTNYPKTYKVYQDRKLLSKANGKNTKVKIDISEQRMKLYVNGRIAMDSPCTTGSRHKLEPNTKVIRDKNGKKVYHGDRRKYKGSWKNARFVGAALHDWMRLTSSGIGMHGSRYIKRYPGSNGCIRLPFTVAKTVFKKVKPGTKVQIVN